MEDKETGEYVLANDPPGALDLIAVLVGQADGKTFIPTNAIAMLRGRTEIRVTPDPTRDGYVVEVHKRGSN